MHSINNKSILTNLLVLVLFLFGTSTSYSQYAIKWMSVGSLQNWYSEVGSEYEEGYVKEQQYGLQWPAIYLHQDIQAAKAIWIGTTNFTDPSGTNYPYKVVHVGPRVTGAGEFYPVGFELISQFEAPQVFVDYDISEGKSVEIDEIDANLIADRMIVNTVNTQIGLTMTRKIFQFSQAYHDNYIISEYTFKNTGNVDDDAEIELPSTTLTGVYFYYQYRLAPCANTRYEIGNGTGWGMNTMIDARGDGPVNTVNDPSDEQFRAQFVWHGKFPAFSGSGNVTDNIGGPLYTAATNVATGDTVGRLGAPQFAGLLTLHADVSATDKSDDVNQPRTTSWKGSDETQTSNNDAYNIANMTIEYNNWIAEGHKTPRHAIAVEPTGEPGFLSPTGDPALGTPGGFSACNGYGPYTLAPGDSVTVVIAEAVSGISRELATETGIKYKQGEINSLQKNQVVFQGQDSLFQTFRRAIANYESGYNIPRPPLPPKIFNVNGLGDRIALSWDTYDNPGNLEGFEIYRAVGTYDSTYTMIASLGPDARSYDDVTPIRGLNYFYYIVSVGNDGDNTGEGLTPAGNLRSSRYYTQTYNEAVLKRKAGTSMDSIRVVPNPYNISADKNLGYGELAQNRLYFFNVPGRCEIQIFTELGELVQTIEHLDGSGDQAWDSLTSYGQIVVSGIYVAVIKNLDTGEQKIVKFVIIR